MFAILETGSKQYRVEEGDILEVELLDKEKISQDNKIDFDSVLLVKDLELHLGQPFVEDARISASVVDEFKAPKVIIFKKKSKKQYQRKKGHRQQLHRILIDKIQIGAALPSLTTEEEKTAETQPTAIGTQTTAKTDEKPKAADQPRETVKKQKAEKAEKTEIPEKEKE